MGHTSIFKREPYYIFFYYISLWSNTFSKHLTFIYFSLFSDICIEENNRACALETYTIDRLYSSSYERFKQRDDIILMDYSKFGARLLRIMSILILIASTKF